MIPVMLGRFRIISLVVILCNKAKKAIEKIKLKKRKNYNKKINAPANITVTETEFAQILIYTMVKENRTHLLKGLKKYNLKYINRIMPKLDETVRNLIAWEIISLEMAMVAFICQKNNISNETTETFFTYVFKYFYNKGIQKGREIENLEEDVYKRFEFFYKILNKPIEDKKGWPEYYLAPLISAEITKYMGRKENTLLGSEVFAFASFFVEKFWETIESLMTIYTIKNDEKQGEYKYTGRKKEIINWSYEGAQTKEKKYYN